MSTLVRLVFVLATVLFAAQPIAACYFSGAGTANAEGVVAAEPGCHDDMASSQVSTENTEKRSFCPSGSDCDEAMMQTMAGTDDVAFSQESEIVALPAVLAHFTGFDHIEIVRKTGPPGRQGLTKTTPLTLKQRLLL